MPALITLDTLNCWLQAPAETERLEFKEAKQQYDSIKLMRYFIALANEGGGHVVLGVSDKARAGWWARRPMCRRKT